MLPAMGTAAVQGELWYGHAISRGMPNSWIAWRLLEALLPSVSVKSMTWLFTDHCRYCSLKSGAVSPDRM